MLSGKPQITVGVVLQNHHAVLFCQLIQLFPLFPAHGNAGGVLEVGNGIDKLCSFLFLQSLFQCLHIHSVFFHGNAAQANFIGTEGVQRTDKTGLFADNHIPLVAQGFGQQIHHLLCTGGDENIVKVTADVVGLFHVSGHRFPQGNVSFCLAILQCVNGAFRHYPGCDLCDGLLGKSFGGRITGRQGNHAGVSGIFENLTNGRGLQGLYSVGKYIFHSKRSFHDRLIKAFSLFCSIVLSYHKSRKRKSV